MFDGKLIQRVTIVGVVLQIALAIAGHYVDRVAANAYEFSAMMIAGAAGLLYAREFAKGYARGAFGGAIAGGTCGIIGICAANILGAAPFLALPIAAAVMILIGAIGGLFGQMAANIRKLNA